MRTGSGSFFRLSSRHRQTREIKVHWFDSTESSLKPEAQRQGCTRRVGNNSPSSGPTFVHCPHRTHPTTIHPSPTQPDQRTAGTYTSASTTRHQSYALFLLQSVLLSKESHSSRRCLHALLAKSPGRSAPVIHSQSKGC
jgi:hypothetical protein